LLIRIISRPSIRKKIIANMKSIFKIIVKQVNYYEDDLNKKFEGRVNVEIVEGKPSGNMKHYYTHQIAEYAKKHNYYFYSSLLRKNCLDFTSSDVFFAVRGANPSHALNVLFLS